MATGYEDPQTLAEGITRARKLAGWGQKALAHEAGVSIGTVKRWEAGDVASLGKSANARRATAILVAELTGASREVREVLGLEATALREGDVDADRRLRHLEDQVTAIRKFLLQGEPEELRDRLERADAFARQHDASSQRPAGQTREAGSQ